MAPDALKHQCRGRIVKAHTVAKSSGLKDIARDGHVYGLNFDLNTLWAKRGRITAHLVGVNQASTFTGFCQYHDTNIFKPIEQEAFQFTPEQCFLVGYRANCRDTYTKRAERENLPLGRQMDRGRPTWVQRTIQEFARHFELGTHEGSEDVMWHKAQYDLRLVRADYSDVMAYGLEFDNVPGLLASGGIFPEVDFAGRELQDVADLTKRALAIDFAVFASNQRGFAVFVWLPDSAEVAVPFVRSLDQIQADRKADAIVRFLFEHCENIYMAPDWWEGLGEEPRQRLLDKLNQSANPFKARDPNCLAEDGMKYANWGCKNVVASTGVLED
jgi:hypothetical protein